MFLFCSKTLFFAGGGGGGGGACAWSTIKTGEAFSISAYSKVLPPAQNLTKTLISHDYVVVQFFPWFKFYFPLFWSMVMYDFKKRKIKFIPRKKLNHNNYIHSKQK